VDIFKAIFEPDSESDEEEEEEESGNITKGAHITASMEPHQTPPTEGQIGHLQHPATRSTQAPPKPPAPDSILPAAPSLPSLAGGSFAKNNPYLYIPPKREERGNVPLQEAPPTHIPSSEWVEATIDTSKRGHKRTRTKEDKSPTRSKDRKKRHRDKTKDDDRRRDRHKDRHRDRESRSRRHGGE